MAFKPFEYDPLTGVEILWEFDPDSQVASFRKQEDLQGLVDWAAENRKARKDDAMMKSDQFFCLFASIPPTIELELLKKGININTCETKDLVKEIETNYPYLKSTERKLWRPT